MSGTVGVLLLAAGRGTRFGSDKRLARLPGGERLLDCSIATVHAADLPLCVALGPGDETLAMELEARAIAAFRCADAPRGMGATLAEATGRLPPWEAVLIALADMPYLRSGSLRAVAAAATAARICVPAYKGCRGHPVAFGRHFRKELQRLGGDHGARGLIERFPQSVSDIVLDDPGILRDIDRPEDLASSVAPT
ncbi:nucleotidyltransferase family protein [Pseudohaliea rubra]|uniref:CTP:molybdopterin cytidylyltransferase n=1 Tax=Pseudohaliea rubra DSM 19751 TaxID=1265313 RepID=A0A095X0C3_9GAMM|nr:nucleotidyltransferase family protein [Pseudohaliea rubra]KGE04339.1 CTP:molybdopterin cytidylyltransferase [Pseudohaliea rubra DSM 19751]